MATSGWKGLIDWDSSTYNGFNGSAYYADDYISIIYMLLLSLCTKEEEVSLKECTRYSVAGRLIVKRREFLRCHPKEVIDLLYEIERERVSLRNIDNLQNRCQQIIETIRGGTFSLLMRYFTE
ncbi:unnamed protein product [Didymodactylos carnosus]|uniref:Uncharacterized protein n=1 Tax=Didymodactylos carnosus TaxID=1234261 RepID=A0A815IGG7_9BILA|nr:unnamed protein product [Didymodactylos carnosus]CAF4246894.1 unnamed protein product [Didymodactylos carnosus]